VYLDACIKESMRLHPPAFALIRQNEMAPGALDVLGRAMPPGAHMLLFTYGVHRDPAYWERAEEYLPERFLPVGFGRIASLGVWPTRHVVCDCGW
jgi:cytochrome P450